MGTAPPTPDLNMTAGLPYARRMRVTGGKTVWPDLDQAELQSQVRVGKLPSTPLLTTLEPYLEMSFDGEDIVVDLSLTGEDTWKLYKILSRGYFDIILSDKGVEDARALPILTGKVKLRPLTTKPSGV